MRDVGSSRPKLRGLTTINKFTSYRISCAVTNLGHQPKDDRQLDEDSSFLKSSSIRPLHEQVSISLCRCFILPSISLKANRVMQILRSRSSRLLTPEIVWLERVSLHLVYLLDICKLASTLLCRLRIRQHPLSFWGANLVWISMENPWWWKLECLFQTSLRQSRTHATASDFVRSHSASNQEIRHLSQLFFCQWTVVNIFEYRKWLQHSTHGHCPCSISGSDLKLFISSIHVKSRRHRGWYNSHKSAARFHDGQLSSFLQLLSIEHQNKEDHLRSNLRRSLGVKIPSLDWSSPPAHWFQLICMMPMIIPASSVSKRLFKFWVLRCHRHLIPTTSLQGVAHNPFPLSSNCCHVGDGPAR